jgi:tripeptide aminopeptidase
MISKERMTQHLMDLIRIDSPSKMEKNVALKLEDEMKELGAECIFDNVGNKIDGNVGNLIVKVKGNKDAPTFFLSSHMDTVAPGLGIQPRIDDGIMRSDGTTILGGDDKSGVSIIVEVIRTLKEQNIPHGDIEVAFTICEEIGLLGAKYIDISLFKSKYGIVLDSSTPKKLVLKCPTSDVAVFKIHGLEAHAGLCPENGINSIKIVSEAISNMKIGRIDHETTSNIGVITGGVATNIIPNFVMVKGEARSHNNEKLDKEIEHMCKCFNDAAEKYSVNLEGETIKPTVEIEVERVYEKMDVSSEAYITRMVDTAVKNLGHEIEHQTSGGGCDANYFNNMGIECVNLGTGMYELHTVNEYVIMDEFYRSADIVLETIQLNTA